MSSISNLGGRESLEIAVMLTSNEANNFWPKRFLGNDLFSFEHYKVLFLHFQGMFFNFE